jgi:hypothetical protein
VQRTLCKERKLSSWGARYLHCSYCQVSFLVPVITLKVAEPVVGTRNVISILFQQKHDISKGCEGGGGLTFKECINSSG